MKIKTLAVNGLIAALYIAVSFAVQPIAFSAIQFRISEIFNHLIVFNKKYFYGIILGVFLTNLFFSPMRAYDLIFGTGQSILALLITIAAARFVKNIWARMAINTAVFTLTMFMIAIELKLALGLPFWFSWLTVAIGEFVVLAVGAPLIKAIDKRIHFERLIEDPALPASSNRPAERESAAVKNTSGREGAAGLASANAGTNKPDEKIE